MMDVYEAVIIGVTIIPIFGMVLGWYHDALWLGSIQATVGPCPACKHPEHWPWCKECGCDLFTEPED